MSSFFSDLAHAAVPVAGLLLLLAATASAVQWARLTDERAQRLAGEYREPLTTWCFVALGAFVLASAAAGDVSGGSLVGAVLIGAGAVLLRRSKDPRTEEPPRPAEPVPAPQKPAPTPPRTPAPSLWANPAPDAESHRKDTLWSR